MVHVLQPVLSPFTVLISFYNVVDAISDANSESKQRYKDLKESHLHVCAPRVSLDVQTCGSEKTTLFICYLYVCVFE